MKKILSLLVLLVAFASCEEDVKFNNPAVQAFKGTGDTSELWKAREFSAVKSGNSVIVTAKNDIETIVLRIDNPVAGDPTGSVHPLGDDELNKATYQLSVDGVEDFYQTGTGTGDGEIVIRRVDENNINATNGKGYISGTFWFHAVNEAGETISYDRGIFYKVPIVTVQ
jgi:hypothetical protein